MRATTEEMEVEDLVADVEVMAPALVWTTLDEALVVVGVVGRRTLG